MSIDPLTNDYPWYTPYQFAGNKPIKCSDVDCAEENDQSTYVYKPKPAITKLDDKTIYKLKQEKLHMLINEYAKKLLETKGIKITGNALLNTFIKILYKVDNTLESKEGTQRSGLALEAPTNGGDGNKTLALIRGLDVINIDLLLAYTANALKSPLKGNIGDGLNGSKLPGAIVDAGGVTQEVKELKQPVTNPSASTDTTFTRKADDGSNKTVKITVDKQDFKEKGDGATPSNVQH